VTRAGVATYIDSAGAVQSAAPDTQRIDWSRGTPGLLVEESRTNILLYSEDLQDVFYDGLNLTVGSPDADGFFPLTETAVTAVHSFRTSGTGLDPTKEFALQLIVKPGLRQHARLSRYGFNAATGTIQALEVGFDFVNKTVIAGANSGGGTIDEIAPGIFRITANPKVGGSVNDYRKFVFRLGGTSETNLSYAGDDTQVAMWIKSPQAEESTFATSYIPTEATAVTRNADNATMTGTNFSDWFNASEGTVWAQFDSRATGQGGVFSINNGSSTQRIDYRAGAASGYVFVNGNLGPFLGTGAGGNTLKASVGIKDASFAGQRSFGNLSTTSNAIPTGLTTLNLGSLDSAANFLNGHLQKFAFYNQRVLNAEISAQAKI
jgi:hypothetical protein